MVVGVYSLEHFQEKYGRFSARKILKNKELDPMR